MERARRTPTKCLRAPIVVIAVVAASVLATLAGCGSGSKLDDPGRAARTVKVPGDVDTLRGAMDVAVPGDLILISPGLYEEAVTVTVPRIVIRGLSRSGVVLEGGGLRKVGITVKADGVAVENLTVQHFAGDGLRFSGATVAATTGPTLAPIVGYRASYVTTVGNGRDGIRAQNARRGLVEHVYAGGNSGAGIGLRDCKPCNALVRDSIAEYDAVGFDATNAGGDVTVMTSVFRHDQVGIRASSAQGDLAPQAAATIAGNLVHANGDPDAPPLADGGYGMGIVVAGGTFDRIEHNRVIDNPVGGIVVTDQNTFAPRTNRVSGNVLDGNGTDLVYGWQGEATEGAHNCFDGNTFTSSKPTSIEVVLSCGSTTTPTGLAAATFPDMPTPRRDRTVPRPPTDLAEQPNAKDAPPVAANQPVPPVAIDRIPVPAAP